MAVESTMQSDSLIQTLAALVGWNSGQLARSVLSWESRRAVQNAMRLHRSQMVWFRQLYIAFSRYMVINSLCEINQSDVEFEILNS